MTSVHGASSRRKRLLITVAVLGGVVVGFLFGRALWWSLRPTPEFDSLIVDPDPSLAGTVAFNSSGTANCVSVVAAAGGEPHEVACIEGFVGGGSLRWLPDGRLQATHYPGAQDDDDALSVVIDVSTGNTEQLPVDQIPSQPEWKEFPIGPNGEVVEQSSRSGTLTLTLATAEGTRRLLSVGAPSTYTVGQLAWSSDGSFFVVKDDLDRLLLVTTNDPSTTRVLAIGAWGPAVTDQEFDLAPDSA